MTPKRLMNLRFRIFPTCDEWDWNIYLHLGSIFLWYMQVNIPYVEHVGYLASQSKMVSWIIVFFCFSEVLF